MRQRIPTTGEAEEGGHVLLSGRFSRLSAAERYVSCKRQALFYIMKKVLDVCRRQSTAMGALLVPFAALAGLLNFRLERAQRFSILIPSVV